AESRSAPGSGRDGSALWGGAGACAQGRGDRTVTVRRAATAARAAVGEREAAGSRVLSARRGALYQRREPSQAFVLRGVELGHGGLHRPRAISNRGAVPLSP